MNDKAKKPKRHILRSLLLLFFLLVIGAFGVSYALGWITIGQSDDTITIEIRTGKAKQDTGQAVKKTKDATAKTGKTLQNAGKRLESLGDVEATPKVESEPTVPEKDDVPVESTTQPETD